MVSALTLKGDSLWTTSESNVIVQKVRVADSGSAGVLSSITEIQCTKWEVKRSATASPSSGASPGNVVSPTQVVCPIDYTGESVAPSNNWSARGLRRRQCHWGDCRVENSPMQLGLLATELVAIVSNDVTCNVMM